MTQHLVKARLARRDQGATAVEYGLMIALIAIIILTAVALLGQNLSGVFDQTAQSV
jgi:pilus assembly protein Flp/PilA